MNNAITVHHPFRARSLSHPGRSTTPEMTVKGSRDRNICGTLDTTGLEDKHLAEAGGIGNGSYSQTGMDC